MEPEVEDPIKTDEGNNTINNNKYNANELALAIETDPNYSCLINAIHQLPDTQIKQFFSLSSKRRLQQTIQSSVAH